MLLGFSSLSGRPAFPVGYYTIALAPPAPPELWFMQNGQQHWIVHSTVILHSDNRFPVPWCISFIRTISFGCWSAQWVMHPSPTYAFANRYAFDQDGLSYINSPLQVSKVVDTPFVYLIQSVVYHVYYCPQPRVGWTAGPGSIPSCMGSRPPWHW